MFTFQEKNIFRNKDYFRITFCSSDLICNKDIKDNKFVCMGVECLAFSILLHTKSAQKRDRLLILCTNYLKNPLKTSFLIRNLIYLGRVWIVIRYFLFEKEAFVYKLIFCFEMYHI